MTIATAKWTVHDYHRMIDAGILDDRSVELLNGEIVEMSPEGIPHANGITKAANYLRKRLEERAEIREGKPITLSDRSEPEPDIAIVEPLEDEYDDHHPYPANVFWLIEFSNSSLEKDLEIKRKTYAAEGIQEYWVVNLRQMKLIIFRLPDDGDYQEKSTREEGIIYPAAFPDVPIEVARFIRNRNSS